MANANAITNPTNLVDISLLNYFEGKLAQKYQTQAITAISGMTATTVEGALAELLGKIQSIPSAIIPKGTRTFSQLAPSTDLVAGSLGFMWNISDAFTTTSDFAEGSGKAVAAGSNIYVANVGTAAEPSYKYDIFAGPIDLSGYKTKQTAVADADATTSGNAITFVDSVTQNANGEITVHKKSVQLAVAPDAEQSIAGQDGLLAKEDKAKLDALNDNLGAKADKDADAVEGNIAEFDGNGNPVDSGHALSEYKTKQSAVSDPTASGYSLTFIATAEQNANGEITVTKKTVKVGSSSDIDEIFADSSSSN